MNSNFLKEKVVPHLAAVLLFALLSFAYLSPLLSGDRLQQHDYIQAMGMTHELTEYENATGHHALWTNCMFSGMPSVQVYLEFPLNLIGQLSNLVRAIFIHETNLLFLLMLGFYVMLFPLVRNAWMSAIGAIAFTFCSFNLVSIEAGHLNKILALAFVAPVWGGMLLAYRGRWLTGAAIFAVFLSLQIRANHMQLNYYTAIFAMFFGLYAFIDSLLKKQLPLFAKATGVLLIGAMLALATNVGQLWGTQEYAKATIRGSGSELTTKKTDSPDGGLDTAYAFRNSEGIDETLTILIPNFRGGGQMQSYSDTKFYNTVLNAQGINPGDDSERADKVRKAIDSNYRGVYYWGGGGFEAAPIYFGAIVCFLFIFGLFVIRSSVKWVLVTIALIAFMMAWGKHFGALNYFLFSHLPMYNKFRTPSMVMSIANIVFVLTGILALKDLVDGGWSKEELLKKLTFSGGVTFGILVVFGLLGSFFYGFHGDIDDQLAKNDILNDVLADRKSLLLADTFRSIMFIAMAVGLIWVYITQKVQLQARYLLAALGLLILVDLWLVDKRAFNDSAFVTEAQYNKNFKATQADAAILQDKELSYRVMDERTGDPFTNAKTSYFHKSVGGYHAAKIRIYQELIENQITKDIGALRSSLGQGKMPENIPALNMLNTKYVIFGDSAQQVFRNPGALGNAWFVNEVKYVPTADAEMAALATLNPKTTAIVRESFKSQVGAVSAPDSTAKITLTKCLPDKLSYESTSNVPALAVFSEIYYLDGKDWKVTIDGKEAGHVKANYVLRAMALPAGTHKIEFSFEPAFYAKGGMISLIASLIMIAFVGVGIYLNVVKSKEL